MERIPSAITVQSLVARGFVGNSAVIPGFLACRVEPYPVHTVLLGAHGAVRPRRGGVVPSPLFYGLLRSLEEAEADLILSGYLGSAEQGEILADWLSRRMAAKGSLPYLLDPVLGDDPYGLYVTPAVVDVVRERLLPMAQVITPNPFEVLKLAGMDPAAADRSEPVIIAAARRLLASAAGPCSPGPDSGLQWVIVTSWRRENNRIYTLALGREAAFEIGVNAVPWSAYGTGDLFAAIVAAGICHGRSVPEACAAAACAVTTALKEAQSNGADTVMPIGLPDFYQISAGKAAVDVGGQCDCGLTLRRFEPQSA
ncbi:pyridoxal kinase [Heliomicrobium modesticaldum Ice1]|uniref:pyridoxal kinase n=1 Tax=Heliobacterium modesticaldum (strain ATCC 51547 / Ice1) TaxID=498761 RepID=B0TGU0_HELMI|nr:bifunctional hydroxymethylpyrimidine kinase/phosphomethylpyrimidine kinase [Heliomicrobium modesticaldum]ABZ84701.1 pyridoxal kinase [Heliomicrobium modesticaldum Ice1]